MGNKKFFGFFCGNNRIVKHLLINGSICTNYVFKLKN